MPYGTPRRRSGGLCRLRRMNGGLGIPTGGTTAQRWTYSSIVPIVAPQATSLTMSEFQHYYLSAPNELMAIRSQWNDLWERSFARQPTVRAEALLNWLDHFSGNREFRALCVEEHGQLVAALPLLKGRWRGVYPVYELPTSCWANSADFLIDKRIPADGIADYCAQALRALSPAVLSFEEIAINDPQWVALARSLTDAGGYCMMSSRQPVGIIDLLGNWDAYQKSWSSNHRSAIKRSERKLSEHGRIRAERKRVCGAELDEQMRIAFEIEDRSWKGEAGTSVVQTPGMLDFMLNEAQVMAAAGFLDLWYLYIDDRPIAFEYCHLAKGTCFSHKIGYDPEYSKYGPGRLLRKLQLHTYHAEGSCRVFDMLGTLCSSKAKWSTRTYEAAHLYATASGGISKTLLSGYAWASRFRHHDTEADTPKLGAASYLQAYESGDTLPVAVVPSGSAPVNESIPAS